MFFLESITNNCFPLHNFAVFPLETPFYVLHNRAAQNDGFIGERIFPVKATRK